MEFKEIQDLLRLINRTNLAEVTVEQGDFKLKVRRESRQDAPVVVSAPPQIPAAPTASAPQASPPAQQDAAAPAKPEMKPDDTSNLYVFKSPMIGTFYRSSSPEADAFVNVGDRVQKGQVLCIIEAMKLFNEIESEIEGKIVKILVENAQPIEYDQDLFLIDPQG